MKNWKKILGLMSIAGCAVALTGNVYAANNCSDTNTIRVEFSNGDYFCTDSFNDAINKISTDESTTGEITLLKDKNIDDQTIAKDMTINLDGHTLTLKDGKTITVDSANVTFKNGTITLKGSDSVDGMFTVNSTNKETTLTFMNDVVVKATDTSNKIKGNVIKVENSANNKTTVNVNGTWTIPGEIIDCDGGDSNGNLTVNLNAKINSTGDATTATDRSLLNIDAGTSTINILGGEYTLAVTGNAIVLKNGTLNISGGKITATKGNLISVQSPKVGKPLELNITGGELIANADKKFVISFGANTSTGKYSFAGGTYTSGGLTPAMEIKDKDFLDKQQGIITGGTYNHGIVGEVDVANGKRPAENAIKTLLGVNVPYSKSEDGTITVTPAKTEDPEGQGDPTDSTPTPTPDTTLDDVPQTYDGIMTYVTMALTSVGAVALSLKKVLSR